MKECDQVIILAAGRGTRMGDLTEELPKPLLMHEGKTLLEHRLDLLPDSITEIVLVIGYMGEKIRKNLGDSYKGKDIVYVEQGDLNGTAGALKAAEPYAHDRFLVMHADDTYSEDDVLRCLEQEWAICAKEVQNVEIKGELSIENGLLKGIVESKGSHFVEKAYVNMAVYVLGKEYFDYPMELVTGMDEYGLPQTLINVAKDHDIHVIECTQWKSISRPEDL